MHVLISQSVNRMASLAFWLAISDLSTRSSALAVFTVLSLIGLAVLGVLYYRKSQLQGAVDAQFGDSARRPWCSWIRSTA